MNKGETEQWDQYEALISNSSHRAEINRIFNDFPKEILNFFRGDTDYKLVFCSESHSAEFKYLPGRPSLVNVDQEKHLPKREQDIYYDIVHKIVTGNCTKNDAGWLTDKFYPNISLYIFGHKNYVFFFDRKNEQDYNILTTFLKDNLFRDFGSRGRHGTDSDGNRKVQLRIKNSIRGERFLFEEFSKKEKRKIK